MIGRDLDPNNKARIAPGPGDHSAFPEAQLSQPQDCPWFFSFSQLINGAK